VAIDFQSVFPQEAVNLSKVTLLEGPVRSLRVIGEDFRAVDEVLINDVASPDFVVLSATQLIAQVPDMLMRFDRVLTVTVLSKRLTVTPRSLLRFRISRTPGKVSGLQRLIQLFLKILFTTPGRDIFNKRLGGAALRNVGSTFGIDSGGSLIEDFVVSVDNTARQIVAIQGRNASIPRSERLLSATVERANFNKESSGLDVTVAIKSQAGEVARANVEL
jgi:hypothetical protein